MESNSIIVHKGELPLPESFIRCVCLSDTHSKTNVMSIPPGDILLHSGDFSRMGEKKDILGFNKFLSSLPHRHKVVIAGNHDITFDLENESTLKRDFNILRNSNFREVKSILKDCIYLEDSFCIVENYKIYGSPWTPRFYD